jgi:hypothetical protein
MKTLVDFWMKKCVEFSFSVALRFELMASLLLGRRSYHLSHSTNPVLIFLKYFPVVFFFLLTSPKSSNTEH